MEQINTLHKLNEEMLLCEKNSKYNYCNLLQEINLFVHSIIITYIITRKSVAYNNYFSQHVKVKYILCILECHITKQVSLFRIRCSCN